MNHALNTDPVSHPGCSFNPALFDYRPMTAQDVDQMVALEQAVYPMPWSRGNFADALNSAYPARVLRDHNGQLLAYFLLMTMVDEVHLLNLAVRLDRHGHGLGRLMLDQALACARGLGMESMLLEVRPSNRRALALYARHGFLQVGLRKAYYPAPGQQREDAIVMRRTL